jgi:hypothetical protein
VRDVKRNSLQRRKMMKDGTQVYIKKGEALGK